MKKRLSDFHSNMKLYVIEEGRFKRFVILDTEKFLKYLDSKEIKRCEISKEEDILNPIIGSIVIEKNSKETFWTTISIAAEHGYGPLLYEIAMSDVFPNYLCPDDPSRVNDDAKKIWKKFCLRKDTEKKIKNQFKKSFEVIDHPALKINSKYCLFYQYKIDKAINFKRYLISKKYIKNSTNNQTEFEQILSDLASNFFIKNYILPD